MRKIEGVTKEEHENLEWGYKNHPKAHFRKKCHSILLSIEGYTVAEIAALYKVRTRTVYTWFNRWELYGILGMQLFKGRGVKAILDSLSKTRIDEVKAAVKSDAQSLKKVCENLSETLGFKVTKHMLKRLLKKNLTTHGDVSERV